MAQPDIKAQISEKAKYAYGTSCIFRQRASRLKAKLRMLAFVALVVPVATGVVVASFGVGDYLKVVLWIGGTLAVGQAIVSAWSLVSRWDDEFGYARESASDNYRLSESFRSLHANASLDSSALARAFEALSAEYKSREQQDLQHDITKKEERYAMRCTLHNFNQQCVTCKRVPAPDKPGNCTTCGE